MYVLVTLGVFIGMLSFLLLASPEVGFDFGRKYFLSARFQYGAGIVSLFLAVALYSAASVSKFPTLFAILALWSLIGALIIFVLPKNKFRSIVSWELDTFSPYGRVLGLIYALISGFVIYAAI